MIYKNGGRRESFNWFETRYSSAYLNFVHYCIVKNNQQSISCKILLQGSL